MSASSEASNLSFDAKSIVDPGISSLDQILPELVGDLISKHANSFDVDRSYSRSANVKTMWKKLRKVCWTLGLRLGFVCPPLFLIDLWCRWQIFLTKQKFLPPTSFNCPNHKIITDSTVFFSIDSLETLLLISRKWFNDWFIWYICKIANIILAIHSNAVLFRLMQY